MNDTSQITDDEREPLQYHFVVYAQIVDGTPVWAIDFESAILGDGSVFDPNEGWNTGWRILDDDEIGLDTDLCVELERRLNVPNPRP